jgi:hypothetical protein
MTDGEDLSSRTPPAAFWRNNQQEQVHVYAIGLGSGLRSFLALAGATADDVFRNTALSTGGRTCTPTSRSRWSSSSMRRDR